MRSLRAAALLVLVLVGTSCASLERRTDVRATPTGTASVGKGLIELATPTGRPPSPRPAATPRVPLFVLRLEDQNGGNPAGIPVRITGRSSTTVMSDAKGEVALYEPGTYQVQVVEGCHERVVVTLGGRARVGAASGHTQTGRLDVGWRHRLGPGPPVHTNAEGNWEVGQDVEVSFHVVDRCTQDPRPGGTFETFKINTSSNVRLVRAPRLRANGDGRDSVVLRCTAPGSIDVVAEDSANRSDRTDLMAYAVGYQGAPECRARRS